MWMVGKASPEGKLAGWYLRDASPALPVSASGSNQWLNFFVDACAASDVSLVKIIVDKTKLDRVQKPN